MLKYSMFDTSCKNLLVRGVNWIGDGVMKGFAGDENIATGEAMGISCF
jgi:hypothetical protein